MHVARIRSSHVDKQGRRRDYESRYLRRTYRDDGKVKIVKKHIPGPQGVRGRNSDNTKLRQVLGWEPGVSLEDGLAKTFAWIEGQVSAQMSKPRAAVG